MSSGPALLNAAGVCGAPVNMPMLTHSPPHASPRPQINRLAGLAVMLHCLLPPTWVPPLQTPSVEPDDEPKGGLTAVHSRGADASNRRAGRASVKWAASRSALQRTGCGARRAQQGWQLDRAPAAPPAARSAARPPSRDAPAARSRRHGPLAPAAGGPPEGRRAPGPAGARQPGVRRVPRAAAPHARRRPARVTAGALGARATRAGAAGSHGGAPHLCLEPTRLRLRCPMLCGCRGRQSRHTAPVARAPGRRCTFQRPPPCAARNPCRVAHPRSAEPAPGPAAVRTIPALARLGRRMAAFCEGKTCAHNGAGGTSA